MSETRSNTLYTRRLMLAGSVLAVPALVGACSSTDGNAPEVVANSPTSESPSATLTPMETTDTKTPGVRHSKYTVIFDYLNHGSKIVNVYATPTSNEATGTFEDGQSAPAYCKEEGRTVASAPGETPKRESDEWIKVMTDSTDNSTEYFASAVYVEDPKELLAELPEC